MKKFKVTSALMGNNTVNLPYSKSTFRFENKGASVFVTEAEAEEFKSKNGFLVEEVETE